ncbi:hypothetical protein MKX01_012440 [Papaver californicum]|nr:hypothetical protein MKX01_012440 [Papaver californicum]
MVSDKSKCLDDVVIKAPTGKRLYRIVHLPNGLQALLIHDPEIFPEGPPDPSKTLENDNAEEEEEDDDDDDKEEDDEDDEEEDDEEEEELNEKRTSVPPTKKAAAAISVGIGSFSDPSEAQGLAHFLEHMLFMGSAEFPDENEYDSYISKHGGSTNAYTETEQTCYHFEVKRVSQGFSQFFVSPLVKAEAMEREVLAVDSEFNQVLQNDHCRLQQLQCHTSASGHAFNKFFWGNKKSLADAVEKGVNLREQILQFYREYYHGGLMKLVVISGESLDVLQEWVEELLNDVKEGSQSSIKIESQLPMWKAGKVYRLQAVKDLHNLNLTWTLPCLREEYLKKLEDYLAHLLGHDIGNLEFRFAQEQPQDDYAAELAENLLRYSDEHIIYGDYAYEVWDDNLIKHVLCFFTAENTRVDILSKSFDLQSKDWNVMAYPDSFGHLKITFHAINHSSYLRLQVLREDYWDVDDKLSCLSDLSLGDLKAFIPELLSELHIECLCHGKLSEEEAISILEIFRRHFPVQPLPLESRHAEASQPIAASTKGRTLADQKVVLYNIIKKICKGSQFGSLCANVLFNLIIKLQGKDKEQLGYTVQCSPRVTYRVLGFCFVVQSSKYNKVYLQGRIDNFIDSLQELLEELDDESFENYKSGLIAKKLEKEPSLRYMYDMMEKEVEELKTIRKSDVINWYKTYISPASSQCRRLAVRVWGCNSDMKEAEAERESVMVIEDVVAYKMQADFYPSLC